MKNGGSFHSYVNVYQKVTWKNGLHITIILLNHLYLYIYNYIYVYIYILTSVRQFPYTVASALSFLVAFAPARHFSTCSEALSPQVQRAHIKTSFLCLATDSRTSLRILLARLPVCLLLRYLSPGSQGLWTNKLRGDWTRARSPKHTAVGCIAEHSGSQRIDVLKN